MSRRPLRLASAALSALSLLLCVGVCLLWAWSYLVSDAVVRQTWVPMSEDPDGRPVRVRWDFRTVWSSRGLLCAEWKRSVVRWNVGPERPATRKSGETAYRWQQDPPRPPPAVGLFGFGYRGTSAVTGPGGQAKTSDAVMAPLWLMAAVTAVLPGRRLWLGWRHRRRARAGHCPKCGYSLTGNTSGVCPECGTAVGMGVAA